MRIGVDLGGTKIEAIALADDGRELARRRVPSPSSSYPAMLLAIRDLVAALELEVDAGSSDRGSPAGAGRASIGVGTPGAISSVTGLIKNANSTLLNGRPFDTDLAAALGRPVRVENDANCFALSEAVDGAGAGHQVVFGVILGTGVGGGIVLDGRVWRGPNSIAGEWGHNEMPGRADPSLPETLCCCGRRRCIETYLSGPGLAADHLRETGVALDARAIVARVVLGDGPAAATMGRYRDRLAGALASVIHLLDPDVIVLGGGLSNIEGLVPAVGARLPRHLFSDRCRTAPEPARRLLRGARCGLAVAGRVIAACRLRIAARGDWTCPPHEPRREPWNQATKPLGAHRRMCR